MKPLLNIASILAIFASIVSGQAAALKYLYLWAKQYLVVGHRRVSVGTLRKILGLEDVKDNSGRVVLDAPLELWANVKQRALDPALKEINKQSDI
jgi:hypothetical protein